MGARDAGIVLGLLWLAVASPSPGGTPAGNGIQPDTSSVSSAAGDSVLLLPEVRVERQRARASRRAPTAFVTEIRPGASGRGLEALPELVRQAPGVHVQQYGGLGAFSTVSVRGSTPGQVALYLDGMPLGSAAHSVVSLADVPLAAVERVEIYRGAAPLGFPQTGAAGAVNLVTFSGAGPAEFRVTRGSFETWEARGAGGLTWGRWSARGHAGYQGSQGDFPWFDDNGTPFNAGDDSVVSRANNRFDALSGLGAIAWKGPGLEVVARGGAFERRQGLAGVGAVPARNAALSFRREQAQLELSLAAPRRWAPRAEARISQALERSRFRDVRAELGLGSHDTDDRLRKEHLDVELEWVALPGGASLRAAGSLGRDRAELADAADARPDPPPSRRESRGAMVGVQIRPLDGPLLLHGAQRWDRHEDRLRAVAFGGAPAESEARRVLRAPQAGLRLALPWGFEARANAARAERAPEFLELFGNQGSVLGNAALRPERVRSWDAGGSWGLEGGAWSASLAWARFELRSEDLILYVRNSQNSLRAQNVTRARVRGDELSVTGAWAAFRLAASFTWQDARDEGEVPYWRGKRLPQRPGREADARLSWERGPWRVGADLHHIGDNYLDRYNRYRLASRTLAGAWLSLSLPRWPVRLALEGKNLGDDRTSDLAGYPLPGRSVFLACETRLGLRGGGTP